MLDARIEIRLPDWVAREVERHAGFDSPEQRMDLVIRLAESNARRGSGGPFAAAVFGPEDRAPIAVGVNLVLASGYSVAHAEVVALSLAQRFLIENVDGYFHAAAIHVGPQQRHELVEAGLAAHGCGMQIEYERHASGGLILRGARDRFDLGSGA